MSNFDLKTGLLAFERSIQVGEAFMYALNVDGSKTPIRVETKGILGQTSVNKVEKNNGKSNLQEIDYAIIPPNHDALEINFNVRINNSAVGPVVCDNHIVHANFNALAKKFNDIGGFKELAERYIWNLANGRFAWRNRTNTDDSNVTIVWKNGKIVFDVFENDLGNFNSEVVKSSIKEGEDLYENFVSEFAKALYEDYTLVFNVSFVGKANAGDEVWPSQEYVPEKKAKEENAVSRVYSHCKINYGGQRIRHATIHSQKINAAIRTIDEWHGDDNYGAITVNPYGGVKDSGKVLRPNDKKEGGINFFDIIKESSTKDIIGDEVNEENLFFYANIIRGGVFGGKD